MTQQKFTNVLNWQVDANSVQNVARANSAVAASIQTTAAASKGAAVQFNTAAQAAAALGISLDQLGDTSVSSQRAEVQAVNQQLDSERQITREMEKQIEANDRAIRGRIGGAGNAGIATGFGGSLRAAGAAVGNIGGGQGVTQAASLIGLAELGPAAVAVGAVAIGLKLLTDNADKAADAIAASAKAYRDVSVSALTQTTEQLESERDALQLRVALDEQFAQQANQAVATYVESTQGFGLANVVLDGTYKGLTQTADEANASLKTSQDELNAYNLVLLEGGGAAAAAAEAEKRLTEARAQFAIDEADILIRLRTTTAEERAERVRAIEDEVRILRQQADAVGKGSEAGAEFEARIISLGQELELTANSAKTYGDALERLRQKEEATAARAEAATERNNQFLEAAQREADARDKAAEISSKITELAEGRDARLLELQADFEDRRTEVVAEGEDRRLEVAKDASDRIAKIERDRGRSVAEAIGNRDANAFRLANQRASDALEDAKEAGDKQAEAAQRAQDKQLASLNKGYDKQVQSTISAANKQISVQQAALSQQLFLAQQARDNQVFLTSSGMNQMVNTVASGWQQINRITIDALNSMISWSNTRVGFGASGAFDYSRYANTMPSLTNSIQGRALDARIDQRLNQTIVASRGGRTLIA